MLVSSSVMETLQYAGRPSIFIELCLAWGGGIRPHTTVAVWVGGKLCGRAEFS